YDNAQAHHSSHTHTLSLSHTHTHTHTHTNTHYTPTHISESNKSQNVPIYLTSARYKTRSQKLTYLAPVCVFMWLGKVASCSDEEDKEEEEDERAERWGAAQYVLLRGVCVCGH